MNLLDRPTWAILPTINLAAMFSRYAAAQGNRASYPSTDFEWYEQSVTGGVGEDGVAYVLVRGVIAEAPLWWAEWEGLCVPSAIGAIVRKYAADQNCKKICFVFDSPGGCTDGIPELADIIHGCGKKTEAIVKGNCCSAAYWLASQCDTIVATRGSVIGCLGVYAVYWDTSKQAEANGIKVRLFSTSDLKGAGEWGTAITEAQAEMFKRFVDSTGEIFAADIKRGRPDFDSATFTGEFWHAEKALELGLIDDVEFA